MKPLKIGYFQGQQVYLPGGNIHEVNLNKKNTLRQRGLQPYVRLQIESMCFDQDLRLTTGDVQNLPWVALEKLIKMVHNGG